MKHSLIVSALLTGLVVAHTGAEERATSYAAGPREATVEEYAGWMERLPNAQPLSRLTIPGTHNSCARHDGLSLGFAKCQSWRLADQLDAGIRFLDIRCRHVGDRFRIHHSVVDQKMSFEQVRDACRAFLKDHPSECIVMSIKEESTAKSNSRDFADTFAHLTRDDGDLWRISPVTPKLGEVRSRIVLIDRVGALGGLRWGDMKLQDQYKSPVAVKAKLIRAHFEKAAASKTSDWYINFCSGTAPAQLLTPRLYAAQSNQAALEFLQRPTTRLPARLGAVVMDFPSEDLIERIVETNFARRESR